MARRAMTGRVVLKRTWRAMTKLSARKLLELFKRYLRAWRVALVLQRIISVDEGG
jgi:hypothetical protein